MFNNFVEKDIPFSSLLRKDCEPLQQPIATPPENLSKMFASFQETMMSTLASQFQIIQSALLKQAKQIEYIFNAIGVNPTTALF